MLKTLMISIVFILFSFILILALFIGYITITDYKPQESFPLTIANNPSKVLNTGEAFSILTFNIGYCGLDKKQDFFMDGGRSSRSSSQVQTEINLMNIRNFMNNVKMDFILLQEVDVNSTRSFHINQLHTLTNTFTNFGTTYGLNYKVAWVPVPLLNPMGSVESGIATLSSYNIKSSTRFQYPGGESWPRQLFELDRCFVVNRIPVSNGKEFVLINSHLSAFDQGGAIRKIQLDYLKKYITREYERGNYVIVGGDWNHVLPGTNPSRFTTQQNWPFWLQTLPADFTPQGFKWGTDGSIPTVRTDDRPYQKDVNFTAVIDGFLYSPNIEMQKVTGHNLGFENSDHNPVTGVFYLSQNFPKQ